MAYNSLEKRRAWYARRHGPRPTSEERFWSKVDKTGECWTWTAALDGHGYGMFSLAGRDYRAQRVSLQWSIGRVLERWEFACHRCDNPPCVRPAHLFVGTALDNMRDMAAKGRRRLPADTPERRANLSEGMRRAYRNGYVNPRRVG